MVKISYIKDNKLDISLYQIYYYKTKNFMMVESFHISHKIYIKNVLLINCSDKATDDCIDYNLKLKSSTNPNLEYFISTSTKQRFETLT